MTTISILGVTGSIGQSSLDLIRRNRDSFSVAAISAHHQVSALAQIAHETKAELAVIADERLGKKLEDALSGSKTKTAAGAKALVDAALYPSDYLIAAISGIAGLPATLAAAGRSVKLALANKESVVCAGHLLKQKAQQSGCEILPVDSEHHALNRLIDDRQDIKRVILTASGGPFRDWTAQQMERATPQQAVSHPNWDMGAKISVDSATLMNKALELIEAHFLFELAPAQLEMVIHPQSIIHALVESQHGGLSAFMGQTDMRCVLADVLEISDSGVEPLSLAALEPLSFEPVDFERFPAAGLAYHALQKGGAAPTILNASNEVAVAGFLTGRIGFTDIAKIVADMLEGKIGQDLGRLDSLAAIITLDQEIRVQAEAKIRMRS